MLDAHVAWLANMGMNYLHSGDLGRLGNDHPNIVPYRPFKTSDGEIIVVVGNDDQFTRFCTLIDRDDLATDPKFSTNVSRVKNREELATIINPIVASKSSAHWLEALEANSIGCGPINDLDAVFKNEQVLAREMLHEMTNSVNGGTPVMLLASPIKRSGTPVTYRHAPPLCGEHTDDVMSDVLGMDGSEIASLKEKGILG